MRFVCLLLLLPVLGVAQSVSVTTYSRSAWVITASSQELSGDGATNGRVAALIDGNNNTFWSSRWATGTAAPFPHTLVVDMRVAQPVNQLYYVPRDSYNSVPTRGSVSFSNDGITFGSETPVTFATAFSRATINLPAVQNRRYFRITLTQNQRTRDEPAANDPVTTMAEIGAAFNPAFSAILSSFRAEPQGNTVRVRWATSLEQNSVEYTVMRSADALNFTPIGTVSATGTPTTASSYSFTDPSPLSGISFYRLDLSSSVGAVQKSAITSTEYPAVAYNSPNAKNLNVFYFIPSDVTAAPDFKNRLDSILLSAQTYLGNEMQRNGRGYKTFNIPTNPARTKVKIIVVNGKKPIASYPYEGNGAGAVLAELDEYRTANPSAFYGSHSLILLPAFRYDPITATLDGRVPYFGLGRDCFALDYADMRQSLLGVDTPKGDLAGTYIGGMVHEMGHGLNLPHNRTKVSETALGTLLMGAGNYTYGKTTTTLSAADAAILNRNEVFNDNSLSYYGPESATIASLHAFYSATKRAIVITGRVASAGSPVTDVTFYNDPAPFGGNQDYDAVSWQTPVMATDSFYVEEPVDEFQVNNSSQYQLRIKLVQRDGNTPEFEYPFSFVNRVPNIAIGTPIYVTAKAGAWNDTSVWLGGAIPPVGAIVTVRHVVTVPGSYVAVGRTIRYDAGGRLVLSNGSKMKL